MTFPTGLHLTIASSVTPGLIVEIVLNFWCPGSSVCNATTPIPMMAIQHNETVVSGPSDDAVLTADLRRGRDQHNHHGWVTIHQQTRKEEKTLVITNVL